MTTDFKLPPDGNKKLPPNELATFNRQTSEKIHELRERIHEAIAGSPMVLARIALDYRGGQVKDSMLVDGGYQLHVGGFNNDGKPEHLRNVVFARKYLEKFIGDPEAATPAIGQGTLSYTEDVKQKNSLPKEVMVDYDEMKKLVDKLVIQNFHLAKGKDRNDQLAAISGLMMAAYRTNPGEDEFKPYALLMIEWMKHKAKNWAHSLEMNHYSFYAKAENRLLQRKGEQTKPTPDQIFKEFKAGVVVEIKLEAKKNNKEFAFGNEEVDKIDIRHLTKEAPQAEKDRQAEEIERLRLLLDKMSLEQINKLLDIKGPVIIDVANRSIKNRKSLKRESMEKILLKKQKAIVGLLDETNEDGKSKHEEVADASQARSEQNIQDRQDSGEQVFGMMEDTIEAAQKAAEMAKKAAADATALAEKMKEILDLARLANVRLMDAPDGKNRKIGGGSGD